MHLPEIDASHLPWFDLEGQGPGVRVIQSASMASKPPPRSVAKSSIGLCLKALNRFWPGLMAGLLTQIAFNWFTTPHPSSITSIPTQIKGEISRVLVSPDSRFVAIHRNAWFEESILPKPVFAGTKGGPATLQLIDLETRQEILSFPHTFDPYGFDPESNLVWVEMQFGKSLVGEAKFRLWRLNSKSMQKSVVYETVLPYRYPYQGTLFFPGLNSFDGYDEFCALSSDCTTLLVPHYIRHLVSFDLIDVASGRKRVSLSLPEINIRSPYSTFVEAEFSCDNDYLLIQTEERKGQDEINGYRLRWFDVKTGQEIHTHLLPGKANEVRWTHAFPDLSSVREKRHYEKEYSRVNRVLYLTKDLLIAVRNYHRFETDLEKLGIIYVSPLENKVLDIELSELKQPSKEWESKYKTYNLLTELIVDPPSKSLITSCQFDRRPDAFTITEHWKRILPKKFLPVHCFGIRNLGTGELIKSFQLEFPKNMDHGMSAVNDELLAILPGSKLVIKRVSWPKWVTRKYDDQDVFNNRIYLKESLSSGWDPTIFQIDASNGEYDSAFPLQRWVDKALFLPNQKELLFLSEDDNRIIIQSFNYPFDYPLHKPWLFILSWSFGIAIGITFLVETRRWWKRRGLAKSNRHLQRA